MDMNFAQAVNSTLNRVLSKPEFSPRTGRTARRSSVIHFRLTEDLDAATVTDNVYTPGTATANVMQFNRNDGTLFFPSTAVEIIITNFTDITGSSGTYGRAERLNGLWQPYVLNCEPSV